MLWLLISGKFETRSRVSRAPCLKDQFFSAANGNHKRILRNASEIIAHSDDDVFRRFWSINLPIDQRNNDNEQEGCLQQAAG